MALLFRVTLLGCLEEREKRGTDQRVKECRGRLDSQDAEYKLFMYIQHFVNIYTENIHSNKMSK